MKNEIVTVGGRSWLVVEAVSMDAAMDAIAWARVRGSVGTTDVEERDGIKSVIADVRLSDQSNTI